MSCIKKSPFFDKKGQCLILSLVFLSLAVSLWSGTLYFSRWVERKIHLQNAVDATLLSGASVLCDGLNKIANLNQKLIFLHHALVLAQAGTVLTSGGLKLTEDLVRQMILATAAAQDVIRLRSPFLYTQKIASYAAKNNLIHYTPHPLSLFYPIERTPPRNGLPYMYVLKEDDPAWRELKLHGFLYRGRYRAQVRIDLEGEDLSHAHWKGVFRE